MRAFHIFYVLESHVLLACQVLGSKTVLSVCFRQFLVIYKPEAETLASNMVYLFHQLVITIHLNTIWVC